MLRLLLPCSCAGAACAQYLSTNYYSLPCVQADSTKRGDLEKQGLIDVIKESGLDKKAIKKAVTMIQRGWSFAAPEPNANNNNRNRRVTGAPRGTFGSYQAPTFNHAYYAQPQGPERFPAPGGAGGAAMARPPLHCSFCNKAGHTADSCFMRFPQLKR